MCFIAFPFMSAGKRYELVKGWNITVTALAKYLCGIDYEVIGIATHSETHEAMVVYRPLYGEGKLWVRPAAMFAETVTVEGKTVPRFAQER